MILTLYAIERRIKGKTVEERFQVRQTESRPVMDKMREWLEKQRPKVLPESKLGKAITYVLTRLPRLAKGGCVNHLLPYNLTQDDLKITPYHEQG